MARQSFHSKADTITPESQTRKLKLRNIASNRYNEVLAQVCPTTKPVLAIFILQRFLE